MRFGFRLALSALMLASGVVFLVVQIRGTGDNEKQRAECLGGSEEAIYACYRVIMSNPNDHQALAARCGIFNSLRDFDSALEDCNRSISVSPRNAGAHATRGVTYSGQGRAQQALARVSHHG